MVDEYWSLCAKRKKASLKQAKKIKQRIIELRTDAVKHLEKYRSTNCSNTLDLELAQIKDEKGCK